MMFVIFLTFCSSLIYANFSQRGCWCSCCDGSDDSNKPFNYREICGRIPEDGYVSADLNAQIEREKLVLLYCLDRA